MSVFRAFIAVDLSSEIQTRIGKVVTSFRSGLEEVSIRWVPIENVHLTLKFLGDVSYSNVGVLTEIIKSITEHSSEFEISVGSIGAYPNERRPRVIWIGVEAPSGLKSMHRNIDIEMARLGYEPDRRPFSPHLTLGRVSRNAEPMDIKKISEKLRKTKVGFIGVTRVKEIHLYRSDLKPGGAVYTKIFSASLG